MKDDKINDIISVDTSYLQDSYKEQKVRGASRISLIRLKEA